MSYETWETANTVGMLTALTAPLVLAVIVFLRQRRRRDANGKRIGRPLLWSLGVAFFSFFAFVVVWGLTLQEAFPNYSERWRAEGEHDQQLDAGVARTDNANVIDGVIGEWRPNNANRSDYFRFTERTYASVNPEFDTIVMYRYRVVRRDGPCMRIEPIESEVSQGGEVTQRSSRRQSAFIVCVDPETDQMLMRFDSDHGDVFFTRMN